MSPHSIAFSMAVVVTLAACADSSVTEPGSGNGNSGVGPVATVSFTPATRAVTLWDSIALVPAVRDAAGRPVSGRPVLWSTNDSRVATVSTTGRVKGAAPGQATITATVDGKHGSVIVQVQTPPVAAVTLSASEVSIAEAATHQLEATPRDEQDRAIPGLGITWRSDRPDIAQVNALGMVTAVRPGTALITASAHGHSAEAAVLVTASHPYDLVYQSFDGATPTLWRLDLRNGDAAPVRLVPTMAGANPAISPDGQRIAFVSGGEDAGIWIANRDGSGARELVIGSRWSPVYQPAWSPDGTRIAYTRRPHQQHEQIWIVDVTTGFTVATTDEHEGGQSWPSWSPHKIDGAFRIAYAQLDGSRQHIRTMRDDATDSRAVTTGNDRYDGQPAWSPDGLTIAFQRVTISLFDIWLVDAAGGNERALVGSTLAGSQSAPAWSPDGQLVAFASEHETYGQAASVTQIYTVRANATGLARRTSGAANKQLPAWIMRTP